MKHCKEEFKIWLAGFVDGEGCIGLYRHPLCHNVNPSLQITLTRKDILEYILVNTGEGTICNRKIPSVRHKPSWRWGATGVHCVNVVKMIEPYLKLKKLQAELVLDYWEKYTPYSKDKKSWRLLNTDYYANRTKELNHKGV